MKSKSMENYVCIGCGAPSNVLHKTFQGGFIELVKCASCNKFVDRYTEFDNVLIILDLLLFKPEAFRHVLLNRENSIDGRLITLYLLSETYMKWNRMHFSKFDMNTDSFKWNAVTESQFYWLLLLSSLEMLVNYAMAAFLILFYASWRANAKSFNVSSFYTFKTQTDSVGVLKRFVQAIVLSSYGKLFMIAAAIWAHNEPILSLSLIQMFVLASNIQALKVITNVNSRQALLLLGIPMIVSKFISFMLSF